MNTLSERLNMQKHYSISGCACCPMNRRHFLAKGTAAAMGAAGVLGARGLLEAEEKDKTRIRIVYSLHGRKQNQPDWPNRGFDFGPSIDRIQSELTQRCKGFEFLSSEATGEAQAKAILEADK